MQTPQLPEGYLADSPGVLISTAGAWGRSPPPVPVIGIPIPAMMIVSYCRASSSSEKLELEMKTTRPYLF